MKTLVLYAHPGQQHSTTNRAMANAAQSIEGITFVDLYAEYPRHDLDIDREQQRLLDHEAIVFQFPLMWYSTPSLLKEWQDLVLEYGFAYGEGGESLKGKYWINAVTVGAPETAYGPEGHNKYSLDEMLRPLQATANLCQMQYLTPYAFYAALKLKGGTAMDNHVAGYKSLLESLSSGNFDASAYKGASS